jgi:hypothetical protein
MLPVVATASLATGPTVLPSTKMSPQEPEIARPLDSVSRRVVPPTGTMVMKEVVPDP